MAKKTEKKTEKKRIPVGFVLRPNNTYQYRFTVEGRRYSVYGATIDQCKEKELEQREKIKNGILINGDQITLSQYFEEWCSRREKNRSVKPSTIYTDRRRFKRIEDILGHKRIKKIDRRDVYWLQSKLCETLSSKGVNDTISLLRTIMKNAVNDRLIMYNPCEGVENVSRSEEETERLKARHRFLSSDEISVFFKYAEGSSYYNLFRFMLLTGVRCGEACALTWKDIDEEAGKIHITKTVTRINDKTYSIGTPKTKESKRDIELTEEVKTVLKHQRSQQTLLFGFVGAGGDNRIFTTQDGDIVKQTNVSPVLRNICKKAGEAGEPIEEFSSHTFRCTFISYEIAQGIPLNVIAKQIGHNNTITLQKYYSREDPKQVVIAFKRISSDMGKVINL